MSVIYTKWKCENCKSEFQNYVSFGEPVEDFDYKWKCKECGHVNTLHVPAFNLFEVQQRQHMSQITPEPKLKDCACGGKPMKATTDLGSDFEGSCYSAYYGVYFACEKCFEKTPPVRVKYNPYNWTSREMFDNETPAYEEAMRLWNEGVRMNGNKRRTD